MKGEEKQKPNLEISYSENIDSLFLKEYIKYQCTMMLTRYLYLISVYKWWCWIFMYYDIRYPCTMVSDISTLWCWISAYYDIEHICTRYQISLLWFGNLYIMILNIYLLWHWISGYYDIECLCTKIMDTSVVWYWVCTMILDIYILRY